MYLNPGTDPVYREGRLDQLYGADLTKNSSPLNISIFLNSTEIISSWMGPAKQRSRRPDQTHFLYQALGQRRTGAPRRIFPLLVRSTS